MATRKAADVGGSSASSGKKNKKQRLAPAEATPEIPMGKFLASPEKKTRDGAIKSLAAFIAQRAATQPIGQEEMAKLWKGIFYCFWMSDKPLVQQALAQELADLVLLVPRAEPSASTATPPRPACAAALEFLEGFWDSMIREWPGLDKWRIDKFYLLIRRFANAGLRLLAREDWDPIAMAELHRIMRKAGGAMNPNDTKVPDSITYHLSDVYLEELEKAVVWSEENQEEGTTSEPVPLLDLLQPWIDTVATVHSATVYKRLMDNVLQPLLRELLTVSKRKVKETKRSEADHEFQDLQSGQLIKHARLPSVDEVSTPDDEPAMLRAFQAGKPGGLLRRGAYKRMFDTASLPTALDSRRHRLYTLWKEENQRLEELVEELGLDEY